MSQSARSEESVQRATRLLLFLTSIASTAALWCSSLRFQSTSDGPTTAWLNVRTVSSWSVPWRLMMPSTSQRAASSMSSPRFHVR